VESGDPLGMLALPISSFGDAPEAVEYMFDELVRSGRRRNILNPSMMEVGISIDTGVLSFGGHTLDVFFHCDYGPR